MLDFWPYHGNKHFSVPTSPKECGGARARVLHRSVTEHLVVQAAVVGLSARVDVMEMLEKRVRSRFSYRRHLLVEADGDALRKGSGDSPAAILEVRPFDLRSWDHALLTHLIMLMWLPIIQPSCRQCQASQLRNRGPSPGVCTITMFCLLFP